MGFTTGTKRGRQLLAVALEGRFESWFKGKPSPLAKSEADLPYTLALKSGSTQNYTFAKPTGAEHYILKVSHRDELFQVDTWLVDTIKKVTRDKLVRKKAVATDVTAEPRITQEEPQRLQ